ncbi:MAG: hypothetical protein COA49_09605 [Bacteroidetes bacterium]|nr:MAG: hypothetical protein COA49_09605 [Bacteroidota bacterium]
MNILFTIRQQRLFVVGSALSLFFISSCGTETSSDSATLNSEDTKNELTVEEINADRGDACDCVNTTLLEIDSFTERMNAGEYKTSQDLNAGLASAMSGCMQLTGHKEADKVWSQQMSECESFSKVRHAMMEVRDKALALKNAEQEDFVKDVKNENNIGASGVLDRLRDGTQSN